MEVVIVVRFGIVVMVRARLGFGLWQRMGWISLDLELGKGMVIKFIDNLELPSVLNFQRNALMVEFTVVQQFQKS